MLFSIGENELVDFRRLQRERMISTSAGIVLLED